MHIQFGLPEELQEISDKSAFVELSVDGATLENRFVVRLEPGSEVYSTEPVMIPCPTLGIHDIRARFRVGTCWSPWSRALQIKVVPPPTPQIVAVGECVDLLDPISRGESAEINGDKAYFRVGVDAASTSLEYIAYVDGRPNRCHQCEQLNAERRCTYSFQLAGHVPPGVYPLTVVSVTESGVASDSSDPVMIRWNPAQESDRHGRGYVSRLSSASCPTLCDSEPSSLTGIASQVATFLLRNLGRSFIVPGDPGCAPCTGTIICSDTSQAFVTMPRIAAIKDRQDQAGDSKAQNIANCLPFEYRFHSPAFFPRRGFGAAGEVYGRNGVLIYEGMRFSCDCNGKYEVEFVAETPSVPVDLRLQLQIKGSRGLWHTLTLPPIHVEADDDDLDRPRQQTIFHEGYSSALKTIEWEQGEADHLQLKRMGTARFGLGAEQFREAGG